MHSFFSVLIFLDYFLMLKLNLINKKHVLFIKITKLIQFNINLLKV